MMQSISQGMRTAYELFWGQFYIKQLEGSVITIFGGKHADNQGDAAKKAFTIGALLVEHQYSVLTGGGPGVMVAANCGAYTKMKELNKKGTWTLGIGVYGVDQDFVNPCAYVYKTKQFPVRKQLLMYHSRGFVVFPGGIGTVDELFEVLNLIKTHKIKQVPVILVDKNYWNLLIAWYDHAIKMDFILAQNKNLISIVDTPEEVIDALKTMVR